MRRLLLPLLGILAALAVAFPAFALNATEDQPTGTLITFTCLAGGSAAQAIPAGSYDMKVQTAAANVCIKLDGASSTCAAGGIPFDTGERVKWMIPNAASLSCRGANSILTLHRVIRAED